MHGISSIIYIILVACLLPYAFTVIAKFTGGFQPVDNQNPRDFLANTKGIAARQMQYNKTVLKVYLYFNSYFDG